MSSVTIKNIPEPLYRMLKNRAKQSRRSLNSEVILGLQKYISTPSQDAKEFIDLARKARAMAKGRLTAEEIDQAKREGRE